VAASEPGPVARRRRILQLCLASLWLLDGVPQAQAFMFGRGFGRMVAAAAQGNPAVVAAPVGWTARLIGAHGALAATAIAVVEILLGLRIAWRPTLRLALAASVAWAVGVWWLGEGRRRAGGHGTQVSFVLAGLLAVIAVAAYWPAGARRGVLILAVVVLIVLWPVGQSVGGIFTGMATDPNSGPLLVLCAAGRGERARPGSRARDRDPAPGQARHRRDERRDGPGDGLDAGRMARAAARPRLAGHPRRRCGLRSGAGHGVHADPNALSPALSLSRSAFPEPGAP